jgi:3-oxoacyl-[acyl-carrier-protein] synthase II
MLDLRSDRLGETVVEVTGLGVVSSLGHDLDTFWSNLLHAAATPTGDPDLRAEWMPLTHTYGIAKAARPAVGPRAFSGSAALFGTAAARQCLADAGIDAASAVDRARGGCVLGSAMGDDVFERAALSGETIAPEDAFPFTLATAVADELGLAGPNLCVSTACSAGLYGIAIAADLIRRGEADFVITGGSEAICRVAMGCFNRLQAIDGVACRPFDRDRGGAVMGEGAAVVLLESQRHRIARGWHRVYAVVKGEGWSCDAHHSTIPEETGEQAVRAINEALARSRVGLDEVDLVLAHGTGTRQNDLMESHALRRVFGERTDAIWVSGNKSKLGHTGGAAGAFQGLTAALALARRQVPPTGNSAVQDPECAVRLALEPVHAPLRNVLLNSYAFGGNNISVIMGCA